MNLRSLGYRTDLIFARFAGEVMDRGAYMVIRTPSNPTFYWGNFLLFAHPPRRGDMERWKQLFAQEIGPPEQVAHLAFGWDGTEGDKGAIKPFLDAGFELNSEVVLTARQVEMPPKYNPAVQVRALTTDADWEQATANQIACHDLRHSLEAYTVFRTAKMQSHRAMTEQGLGQWFGAFVKGQLAGDLGLFVERGESNLGRFQHVTTYPNFRRMGVCSTLVYEAAQIGFNTMGAETLVMVADEDYFAARIYESVGFQPTERQVGAQY